MKTALLTSLMVALMLAVPAQVNACTAANAIDIAGTLYIDDRGDPQGTGLLTGGGTWFYAEDNGAAGLQYSGEPHAVLGDMGADPLGAGCSNGDLLLL